MAVPRFRIEPKRSRVWIDARSSLHPITSTTDGLEGHIDLEISDGLVDVGAGPAGRLSLPVARLSSGNKLQDRELHKRIDARHHPRIDGVLTGIDTAPDGRYLVSGELTFRGIARPVQDEMTIQVVDARLITIKPWEKTMIPVIDKAIRASDLGLNPVPDSDLVRLPIPPLTQERRRDLAKVVKKQTEEARVAVRAARRDAMDLIKEAEKDGEISEDERKNGEKKIQELTDKYVAQVDEVAVAKEKEIMEL